MSSYIYFGGDIDKNLEGKRTLSGTECILRQYTEVELLVNIHGSVEKMKPGK